MKLTTANKLNRLWQKGILPELFKRVEKTKILKSMEEIDANTNEENVAGATAVAELNNKLNGCSLEQDGEDFYIVGADAVRKKLGNLDPNKERFIYHVTLTGKTQSYTLPKGIYVFFAVNTGGGSTQIPGVIWSSNMSNASLYYQYIKYGIADMSVNSTILQTSNANGQNISAVFYKLSDST